MRNTLIAFLYLLGGFGMAAEVPKVLPIGSDMPSFSLPGIDGKTHSEKD